MRTSLEGNTIKIIRDGKNIEVYVDCYIDYDVIVKDVKNVISYTTDGDDINLSEKELAYAKTVARKRFEND